MLTLIFGAGGYLGSHLAKHFAAKGDATKGLVRNEASAVKLRGFGAEPIFGDLEKLDLVLPLLDEADTIIYAAQLDLQPEYDTVKAMLAQIEGTGKSFLFTSGTGVLSQRTDGEWSEDTFTEEDEFVPSKYIGARKDTEDFVRAAANRGIRAFVIRPSLIWGNGGCLAIANFYKSAAKTGAVCYLGRGLNLYSNVHVDDLAELYRLAVDKGVPGHLYHAVSGETNFRTLAEGVARALNVPTRSVDFAEGCEIWDKFTTLIGFGICSRSRAPLSRRELGWRPSPDRLDIMEETSDPAFLPLMQVHD
jgi:nucleoside-diphosphate-sugar epimerase